MREELIKLLKLCSSCFTEGEISEVMEFIEVNEYKLALETICAIFYEESKPITAEQLTAIEAISAKTSINREKWERLKANILSNL